MSKSHQVISAPSLHRSEEDSASTHSGQGLVLARQVPPTRTEITYSVPYPTSPEERERVRMELSNVGMQHGVPGLGSTGEIQRAIEAVSYKVLAHEDEHVRDDWQEEDEDYDALRTSVLTIGQQRAIIATPLLPDDPRVTKGKQFLVIKGHRLLQVARRERLEPVFIEVLTRPDGLPLFPYERTALYLALTVSTKPLKGRQIFLAIAKLYTTYMAYCQEMRRPFTFFTIRELGERFGISHTYAREARLIAEEGGAVLEAISDGALQPKAVTQLLRLIPEKDRRVETVAALRQVNAQRREEGSGALSVPEVVALIEQHTHSEKGEGSTDASAERALQQAHQLGQHLLQALRLAEQLQRMGYSLPEAILPGLQRLGTPEALAALRQLTEQSRTA